MPSQNLKKTPLAAPLLRAELFSAWQMEQHGKSLAAGHRLDTTKRDLLLPRLNDNEQVILATCDRLRRTALAQRQLTPASEWLLDNLPLIREQMRIARRHLPKDYSRGLPKLDDGMPRVYALALEAISHSDARIDADVLQLFVASYQTVTPLELGELWAIPIMLRLALIENLRRVAERIDADQTCRDLADDWADRMIDTAEARPHDLILDVADMARARPAMTDAFAAGLARRLHGRGPSLALPLSWLDQGLGELETSIEQAVRNDTQRQAIEQVSVSNSVGSLRNLSTIEWRKFVEALSVVEQILQGDPAQAYARMDFETRDRYRHAVEALAKLAERPEADVARAAIALADAAAVGEPRQRHVGYYLIDAGLPALRQDLSARPGWRGAARALAAKQPLAVYLSSVSFITVAATAAMAGAAHGDLSGVLPLAAFGIPAAIGASHLAVALTNWLTTLLARPHVLPRLDFSRGIPDEARTLVIVPTLLSSVEGVDELVDDLEVRYLANRGDNVHFGLLTDFADAADETMPGDAALLDRALGCIRALNRRYASEASDQFFLFHRPRLWNAQEGVWMGRERKRGKLGDLNAFLLTSDRAPFAAIEGDTASLSGVRYIVTLDSDTQLPRDTVWQAVGAMAHPLNRPVYDEKLRRVVAGYGLVQPRIASSLPGDGASPYAHMFGGEPGIDPYTRAVSDVYQDAFGEGSFIGKGVYDLAMFERVLHDRFPDNRILSHDLLEGSYIRSGLLSDVQFYEEYPSKFLTDVSRRHRWIRGDWQLLGWLRGTVPGPGGKREANPLSALSRWKIFDNLRRSVVPPSLLALFGFGWLASGDPLLWDGAVLALLLAPALCAALFDLYRKSPDVTLRQHLAASGASLARNLGNAGFNLACLPFEAFYSADAILRTLWRLAVSRRRLLEWTAAATARRRAPTTPWGVAGRMAFAPALALGVAAWLGWDRPDALAAAGPVLALWVMSPALAWWVSRPSARRAPDLTHGQTLYLRRVARKTWAFFEAFVGPDDHWLPPDNFQEAPVERVAHRTSPTNMGLSLLANLTAYDFGYIPMGRMIERTENAILTMGALDHYQGHFYNWYDTQSLVPLQPLYVSTVDSGNLAGHLLVLRAGLFALAEQPVIHPRLFKGIRDTLAILRDLDGATQDLAAFAATVETLCAAPPATVRATRSALARLTDLATDFQGDGEAAWWQQALAAQCRTALDDLDWLMPWAALASAAGDFGRIDRLDVVPTLTALRRYHAEFGTSLDDQATAEAVRLGSIRAADRAEAILDLAGNAGDMAEMDYEFLYNRQKRLLAIGYHPADRRIDPGYYDLLASEARLGYFTAIAQGRLPQESWFALGRQLRSGDGKPVLTSWSGSMFEYLMPLIVMPNFAHTLLDQTCRAAVQRQIAYGGRRNVPWGISESGYYAFDAYLNYQYHAFGVPGMGLKRETGDDLVIAPYATAMALMVLPEPAAANLERLSGDGFEGRYGLYEAIDYTPSRVQRGKDKAVVQSYMAHHQGMSLLSFSTLLLGQPMQRRFAADPSFQATMLLLHEKIPRAAILPGDAIDMMPVEITRATDAQPSIRSYTTIATPTPEIALLSNGRYHVAITHAGGGYSRWRDLAVTRWREDATRDHWGAFAYIRDVANGAFWSTAYQPTRTIPDTYEATFTEGRAEFRRRDGAFETQTEIVVSPEDDIELRRTRIVNRSNRQKTIEFTSYAEIVLAPQAADTAHPAFSNLFVQTEILHKRHAILASRRPRSFGEQPPWMFHLLAAHGAKVTDVSYETDRMRFLGRGRTLEAPQALRDASGGLSETDGPVLDPVVAIRYRLTLEPEQAATIDVVTGAAGDRASCEALVDKYQGGHMTDRILELAWTHAQVVLRQINASEADAQIYARLASHVVFPNATLRTDPATIARNQRGQSGLWSYAISGDLPIVLLKIHDIENIDLARRMVQAHAYWRLKGLAVDLVIWNEDRAGYRQALQDRILGLIAAGSEAHVVDRPGGIFVRPGDQISPEDRILLESVACVVLSDEYGPLEAQVNRAAVKTKRMPRLAPVPAPRQAATPKPPALPDDLVLFNGYGGFTPDGREYVLLTASDRPTPAPWSNVIANPEFGTVISERGQSYTWAENAHEYRLSPWHNDPVGDPSGETYYLRDEETGLFWSPSAAPCESRLPTLVRHGFGYSTFEHVAHGIRSTMTVFVATDAAVKFAVLDIRNESGRARRLSATGYVEWVLADLSAKSKLHIVSEIDPDTGAVIARNAYNAEFHDRHAFFDVEDMDRSVTCDRREFVGRHGTMQHPSSMDRTHLSGKAGAALDPCAAIMVPFELADGQARQVVFRLGSARGRDGALALVKRFRNAGGADRARETLDAVHALWADILGAVRIDTPDPSLDILANGWLMYQTIACRMWARSGYYQSGGAYGFRDQLQDAMAVVHTRPDLLRAQLLLHAAHQFTDGDAQHWWHPPTDRGVRTRCSDDYLWLPLAAHRYVTATGDAGILTERVPFIEGRPLNPGEESYYDLPARSNEDASLYEHCVRAITHGLRFGEHGLPLIGSCDWNDGMDKVGEHGRGESVWLGFFLYDILLKFADIARIGEDPEFAVRCELEAARLRGNIEAHAWDGQWYRRAYFDDGTPLGSAANEDCQIDSLSQSWSVLSGAGDPARSRQGMDAVDARLVRRDHGLIQLLDPPFDKSNMNPGYIRGYVPGVRENGGQYTHAAIWTAMAFAKMGDAARAFELLRMINPLNHAATPTQVALYKVEPYVVTADVYGVAPLTGRGGWSWYTGSAGWLYRLIVESVLGLRREGDRLHIDPCLPPDWNGFQVSYRVGRATYDIAVAKADRDELTLDGVVQDGLAITLIDDGARHALTLSKAGS